MVDSPAAQRLPDFVIVGAQKAATTLFAAWLAPHPGVAMPARETLFFRDPEYGDGDLAPLAELFGPDAAHRRRGIKCPEYLSEAPCAPRIHADLGEPQIVVTLRDPVARAVSAYFWLMRWGYLPLEPADAGLAALLDGRYDGDAVATTVLTFGRYADDLERYYSLWPAGKVFLRTDLDLAADSTAVYRSLCEFLGLVPAQAPPAPGRRANTGIYDLRRLAFLARRHHLVRHDVGGHARIAPPAGLGRKTASNAIAAIDRWGLRHVWRDGRPVIGSPLRARLVDYYADDIRRTELLTGCDLSPWLATSARQDSRSR